MACPFIQINAIDNKTNQEIKLYLEPISSAEVYERMKIPSESNEGCSCRDSILHFASRKAEKLKPCIVYVHRVGLNESFILDAE